MRHGTALDDRLFEPPPPMDPEVAQWNGRQDKLSGSASRAHWIPNADARVAYQTAYLAAPHHPDLEK